VRLAILVIASSIAIACGGSDVSDSMGFFVTSESAGDGGNLGGLSGADARCQELARGAGSRKSQWRAYLSTSAEGGSAGVNARDRIGAGPWFNARGVQVASSVAELHADGNLLGGTTSLTESGEQVGYYHDILTGSAPDGTLASINATCRNWTSTSGRSVVGHSNKQGNCCGERATSWNSAHETEGCTLRSLQATGGQGRFYCFALD
jgi:hypothetical protein